MPHHAGPRLRSAPARTAAWALAALVVAACGHQGGAAGGARDRAPAATAAPSGPPAAVGTAPAPVGPAATATAPGQGAGGNPPGAASGDAVLVAAGDIAGCDSSGDEATAALVGALGGTVATLGDTVYERGTAAELARCYAPTWGRFKDRTRPAPGNHDYATGSAAAYLAYFGVPRWYSYDLGAWHVVALDSNCSLVGGCGPGSAEERWLRADLAAHRRPCTLAYWHHPRWSSGLHGSDPVVDGLWRALADAGADVVLSGHDHDYERFGAIDGIRQFVVGTGGRSHYPVVRATGGSEVRNADTFGVLVLTLHQGGYDWRFVPVAGATFTDSGSGACHRR